MCGIVGCVGRLFVKDENWFKDVLIMDQVRGFDSVGLFSVDSTKNNLMWAKSTENPKKFLDNFRYKKNSIFSKSNSVIVGHNRAATMGHVVEENAHPFTHEHITGVHNGTLSLQKLLPDWLDFEVDSENLIYSIAKEGIEETWKNTCGAAALVYWDHKEKLLNIVRNSERPLYYAVVGDVLYFSSEMGIAFAGHSRRKIKVPDNLYHSFDTNTLYQINPDKINEKSPFHSETKLEECKEKPPKKTNYYYGGGFSDDFFQDESKEETEIEAMGLDRMDEYTVTVVSDNHVLMENELHPDLCFIIYKYQAHNYQDLSFEVGDIVLGKVDRKAYSKYSGKDTYVLDNNFLIEEVEGEDEKSTGGIERKEEKFEDVCEWCGEREGKILAYSYFLCNKCFNETF